MVLLHEVAPTFDVTDDILLSIFNETIFTLRNEKPVRSESLFLWRCFLCSRSFI